MIDDLATYSDDGRVLFKAPDLPHFRIPEGVEDIMEGAFTSCSSLREVDIPFTMAFWDEGCDRRITGLTPEVKVNVWDWPYPEHCQLSEDLKDEIANGWKDEFGAVYSQDRKRLLRGADVPEYYILDGTEYVERLAFVGFKSLNKLYFPPSCPMEHVKDLELGNGNVIGEIFFL